MKEKCAQSIPALCANTIGPKVAYWAFVRSVRRLYMRAKKDARSHNPRLQSRQPRCTLAPMARESKKKEGGDTGQKEPPRYQRFRSSYKDLGDGPTRRPFPAWDDMTTEEEYGVDDRLN